MDVLERYGHLRGFCYMQSTTNNNIAFWRDYDENIIERDLEFARRLGLNSARVMLQYVVWKQEPAEFIGRLRHFARAAFTRGISVQPSIWDGCGGALDTGAETSLLKPHYEYDGNDWTSNPAADLVGPDFYREGERYVSDVVEALRGEPGLEMWDVMSEPGMTWWAWKESELGGVCDERKIKRIWDFVHHFCAVVRELDPGHPITVGVADVTSVELGFGNVVDHVDVLSLHDYSPTRKVMREEIEKGLRVARREKKPILISETGSFSRANPYDMAIEICNEFGIGYYFWELMIGVSRWSEIHGLVYPDGTVRDPAAALAISGFFRKRDGGVVRPRLDREGHVRRTILDGDAWLGSKDAVYEDGLETLERMANLLEGGELIAMAEPPTAKVLALQAGETTESRAQLARLLVMWGEILAPYRQEAPE